MTRTACVILVLNAAVMNLFFIKSQAVYQQDKLTASSIVQEIDSLGYDFRHKPIVFLGRYTDETVKEIGDLLLDLFSAGMGAI